MSRKAADWAWKTPAKGVQLLVLLALADYANDKTLECRPSLPSIAEKTGLGTSTVRRELRSLEAAGLIKTEVSSGGRHARSHYHFVITETQPQRAGKKASKQPKKRPETQPDRAPSPTTAGGFTEGNPTTVARNPTRAGGVVPKTGKEPSAKADRRRRADPEQGELIEGLPNPIRIHAGDVTAAWCDAYRAARPGKIPTPQLKGQVSREARQLIEAGNDPAAVRTAAAQAGTKGFATVQREFSQMRPAVTSDSPWADVRYR